MSCISLPEGYTEIRNIDLKNNKKESFLVNGLSLAILLLMGLAGNVYAPLRAVFLKLVMNENGEFITMPLVIVAMALYIVIHEAVHGVFMKKFSGVKAKYGFTGFMAYAGSSAFFSKKHYIIISLSPVVILGLILAFLNIAVPKEWFWFIYTLQIANISGAAGDFYVTYIIKKMPDDILANDSGVSMKLYSKTVKQQI